MGFAYQIPYRSLTPKLAECSNLLVPGAASHTHVAFCTLRLERTWMIGGFERSQRRQQQRCGEGCTSASRPSVHSPVAEFRNAQHLHYWVTGNIEMRNLVQP